MHATQRKNHGTQADTQAQRTGGRLIITAAVGLTACGNDVEDNQGGGNADEFVLTATEAGKQLQLSVPSRCRPGS